MTRLSAIFATALIFFLAVFTVPAQSDPAASDQELVFVSGDVFYTFKTQTATFTNGAVIKWHGAVLTADSGSIDQLSGETVVTGHVRIQQDDQLWTGDHVRYNFTTHQIETANFLTGKPPVFAQGEGLHGDLTNKVYYATNSFITSDDVAQPALKIRSKHIRIIPGKRIEATHATLWLGNVPVFYFPYFSRNLGDRANNFNFTPGYDTKWGGFLLNDYTWFLNEEVDGRLHLDYREQRGVGVGPDVNLHLRRWGEVDFRYYYLDDHDPGTNVSGVDLPQNRQRVYFGYQATPWTNLNVKALVRYQSDSDVVKNFYRHEYREDTQPDSFVELNKAWSNFSLDVLAQPQVNNFLSTVERLPDLRLTGFRQQLGTTPLYYQSESTVGYYEQRFARTNSLSIQPDVDYAAARADTYQQILLPQTYFGWLNVTPHVGGRFTYYSEATGPGATTDAAARGLFDTGAEVSFKATRVWPQIQWQALDVQGVRHIIEPSINYLYVTQPNYQPDQVPQFDKVLPSLTQLPLSFPEFNSIDSITGQNVLRLGINNKFQTKRAGQIDDLLGWALSTDLQLDPLPWQGTFSDVFSDLSFKPRSWLRLDSQLRYDLNAENWRMLLHTLTIEPNNRWSWTLGQYYLRNDTTSSPIAPGPGNNIWTSTLFLRVNENWGFRGTQHYDAANGRMQEQFFTVYRDLRWWTVALTGGMRNNGNGPKDYTVAFSFSLKAMPHTKLGGDTVHPYSLLGQ